MRRIVAAVLLLALAIGAAACGQSSEDKAKQTVCNARDDIGKQVDALKSLTPSTVTLDGVQKNLTAIKNDLNDIKNAQSNLASDRKAQVQQANATFANEVKNIASQLGSSLSVSGAQSQLQAALQQLGSAYQSTFAKINCS